MLQDSFFSGYVPAAAQSYCEQLMQQYDFEFRIARPRRTRLGDFTYRPFRRPRITVNANLNPFGFLITYLHEVAHCMVYRTYSRRVAPHGTEWKRSFSGLLAPVLHEGIFPPDILDPLRRYAQNPGATTSGAPLLFSALLRYDRTSAGDELPAGTVVPVDNKKMLRHLTEGASFVFQGRGFVKGPLRRTRILCTEQKSKRRYTIPAHVLVEECK